MGDVKEFGIEKLRYHVRSRRDCRKWYLVDLSENDGNGWCGCKHFEFKCGPRWKQGETNKDLTRCYHIREALIHLGEMIVKELNPAPSTDERRARTSNAGASGGREYGT